MKKFFAVCLGVCLTLFTAIAGAAWYSTGDPFKVLKWVTIGTSTKAAMLTLVNATASDIALLIRGASSQSGNLLTIETSAGTDLITVNSSGQIALASTAVAYKDICLGLSGLTSDGASWAAPTIAQVATAGDTPGIYTYSFDASSPEDLSGSIILPTDYVAAGGITPRVMWSPSTTNTTGYVSWGLQYKCVAAAGTWAAPTTATTVQTKPGGTALVGKTSTFAAISGSGLAEGSQCLFRLYRDADAATDAFTGEAFLGSVCFRYQADSLGSY